MLGMSDFKIIFSFVWGGGGGGGRGIQCKLGVLRKADLQNFIAVPSMIVI